MFIEREIENAITRRLRSRKVVLVTGSRQVGKTTLLRERFGAGASYVSLDNLGALAMAREDPHGFLLSQGKPMILDEVRRVPELFMAIKALVDTDDTRGTVMLTGSQTYQLMEGISESLAGRIGILHMLPLSLREIIGARTGKAFVTVSTNSHSQQPSEFDLWHHIHRGSMPELADVSVDWEEYYADYVSAYIERDVREIVNVRNEMQFYAFMVACAARTAQLINYDEIARTVGISANTARAWMSVLQASGIVRIVEPFWANVDKRLAKQPKLHFMDTGLACYLTRWTSGPALAAGASAGQMFETFVVSEIFKSHLNSGKDGRDIRFYRDVRKNEIDLVVQDGHTLYPVEIKHRATVRSADVAAFALLECFADYEVGEGSVICTAPEPYPVTRTVTAASVWAI